MHLRHIRPRSVEWYDAILDEVERGLEALSPEEKAKLHTLHQVEQVGGPAVDHAILGSISPRPMGRPVEPRSR